MVMLSRWGNEGTEMLTVPRGQRRRPLRAYATLQRSHCPILLMPTLLAGMRLGREKPCFPGQSLRRSGALLVVEMRSSELASLPGFPVPGQPEAQDLVQPAAGRGARHPQHPSGSILKLRHLQGTLGQLCSQMAWAGRDNCMASVPTSPSVGATKYVKASAHKQMWMPHTLEPKPPTSAQEEVPSGCRGSLPGHASAPRAGQKAACGTES